jgi:hypothetical protein
MTMQNNFGNDLLADLTSVTLPVLVRHGVRGSLIEIQAEIRRAVADVLGRGAPGRDDLLEEVAQAAYGVALRRGFPASFLDLELSLWRAVCSVRLTAAA